MTYNASLLKKLTFGALFFSVSSVSMLSHADVTLKIDDHIKVTAINGQEIEQSLFQPLQTEFTLQPGKHVITAKYDRLYNLPRDEHDYLRSGNISVAADMVDQQTYRLTMPNQPEDYAAAKAYVKQPTLAVQQNDTIIASQQSVAGNNGGLFSGLGKALGGVFGGSGDAEMQNQRAIAALGQSTTAQSTTAQSTTAQSTTAQPTTAQPTTAQPTVTAQRNASAGAVASNTYTVTPALTQTSSTAQTTSTLDSFMQLWLKATPAERAKIRQWVQE